MARMPVPLIDGLPLSSYEPLVAPPFQHQNASKFMKHDDIAKAQPTAEATLERNHETLWEELDRFYVENEKTIEHAMTLDMTKDDRASELDIAIDTFTETANVVLEGLVALGNVHPILGIAVFAFHGIIKLDLARRDNNKKVLAVKLQMQNMMCAMFQLRKLKHVHVEKKDREKDRARLQQLVQAIAKDITTCGSDLNFYVGRKFVAKLVNAKTYERLFADHVETFAQRRAELQSTITSYIAAGIDAANIAIGNVSLQVNGMDKKVDFIISMLRKLDTPREQEALKFMEQNGGPDQCVKKDELLTKLLAKAGQTPANGKGTLIKGEELCEIQAMLKVELQQAEDIQKILAENFPRFEKMLRVQNNNLERLSDRMEEQSQEMLFQSLTLDNLAQTSILILEQGKLIKKAIAPRKSVVLKDPVLQQIWDRMGFKGSVKAKHFVLTFRDHLLSERTAPGSVVGSPHLKAEHLDASQEPSSLVLSSGQQPDTLKTTNNSRPDFEDAWALQYLNVAHVQPIVEAIDEDGSGFISVKEANKFALSRPKGWSLLQWLAYWAAGWHINVTNYRSRIYAIVQHMHESLLSAHPANRSYVDEYLNHPSFNRLEALLRSTKPLSDGARKESKLTKVAEAIAALEEQRLFANLKEMSFVMETPSNVSLVACSERVEMWILPLLCLILSRHLDIIKIGEGRVLDAQELLLQVKSLESIFLVFDERMNHLEAIFRQVHRDVQAQFENFAYGMFYISFAKTEKNPSENTLLTFKDNKSSVSKILRTSKKDVVNDSILAHGLGESFEFEEVDLRPEQAPPEHAKHPLEGLWTGQCIRANNKRIAFQGFFQCTIDPITTNKITGKGETYLGGVQIRGAIEEDEEEDVEEEDDEGDMKKISLEFRIYSRVYMDLWCRGEYDPENEVIQGQWITDDESDDFPPSDDEATEKDMDHDQPCGRFYITRTPAPVFRFRHLLDDPYPTSEWTLARKRWAFATEAVKFQTQDQIGSANFFRARTAERRKWLELTIRRELDKVLSASKEQLSREGKEELWTLRLQMHPTNGRLYDSLALYLFKRMSYNVGLYNCKSCGRRITFARFQCITCMDDKMNNQIDLCGSCIGAPDLAEDGDFVHERSHSLIRSTHRIHECELASMIPQARLRSERIKVTFKVAETKGARIQDLESETANPSRQRDNTTPLTCACCKKPATLPCWVCVACALDTFICEDCDLKRRPVLKREGFSAAHSYDHPLLRISDSSEVKPIVAKASRLERQLGEVESRIKIEVASLHDKVNRQLDGMRTVVEGLANKISAVVPSVNAGLSTRTVDVTAAFVEKTLRPGTPNGGKAAPDATQEAWMNAFEDRLTGRLDALETKVDTQFGALLALMQQLVPVAPALSSVTDGLDRPPSTPPAKSVNVTDFYSTPESPRRSEQQAPPEPFVFGSGSFSFGRPSKPFVGGSGQRHEISGQMSNMLKQSDWEARRIVHRPSPPPAKSVNATQFYSTPEPPRRFEQQAPPEPLIFGSGPPPNTFSFRPSEPFVGGSGLRHEKSGQMSNMSKDPFSFVRLSEQFVGGSGQRHEKSARMSKMSKDADWDSDS